MSHNGRVFRGLKPDGTFDVILSRPGYEARTADVNDPSQVAFAASRGANPYIAEVLVIPALNVWVPFVNAYSEPPRPILAVRRNDGFIYLPFGQSTTYFPTLSQSRAGTLYSPVVQINRMMVVSPLASGPANSAPIGIPPGDSFVCFVVR